MLSVFNTPKFFWFIFFCRKLGNIAICKDKKDLKQPENSIILDIDTPGYIIRKVEKPNEVKLMKFNRLDDITNMDPTSEGFKKLTEHSLNLRLFFEKVVDFNFQSQLGFFLVFDT